MGLPKNLSEHNRNALSRAFEKVESRFIDENRTKGYHGEVGLTLTIRNNRIILARFPNEETMTF